MHSSAWTSDSFLVHANGPILLSRQDASDICLPSSLTSVVPSCADSCIQAFILANYQDTSCSSTRHLSFLCTTVTASGLTIGEASLQCVASTCVNVDLETQSGYSICDRIPGSQPRTASTLTATISTVPTSTVTRPTVTILSAGDASISASSTSTPEAESSSVLSSSQTSNPASTSISAIASPTVASNGTVITSNPFSSSSHTATPTHQQGLSIASIAGIAGGAAGVLFIIAGILIWVCIGNRRRKARRRDQGSLSDSSSLTSFVGGTSELKLARKRSSGPPCIPPINQSYPSQPLGPEKSQDSLRPKFVPSPGVPDNIVAKNSRLSQASFDSQRNPLKSANSPSQTALWPPPLYVNKGQNKSLISAQTRFDGDLKFSETSSTAPLSSEQDVSPILLDRPNKTTNIPPALRTRNVQRSQFLVGPIPLTPIYDNGNFTGTNSLTPAANRSNQGRQSYGALSSPPRDKQDAKAFPLRGMGKGSPPLVETKLQKLKKSVSFQTVIEEDTTPEEEKDREIGGFIPPITPSPPKNQVDKALPRSPIFDLKYPRVPYSSSVKPEALRLPRLRAFDSPDKSSQSTTISPPPTRLTPNPAHRQEDLLSHDSQRSPTTTETSQTLPSQPTFPEPVLTTLSFPFNPQDGPNNSTFLRTPSPTSANTSRQLAFITTASNTGSPLRQPRGLTTLSSDVYVAEKPMTITRPSGPPQKASTQSPQRNRDPSAASQTRISMPSTPQTIRIVSTDGSPDQDDRPMRRVMITPKYSKSGDLYLTVDL